MDSDYEIYKGKTFGQLCKDIVTNSEEKKTQLDLLVTDCRAMITTINDAVTVVPLLERYIGQGIKNDEQLIKLAAIVQRLMNGAVGVDGEGGSTLLTDDEKRQLMEAIEETAAIAQEPDVKLPKPEKVDGEK